MKRLARVVLIAASTYVAPAGAADELRCEGTFGRDTTHAIIVAAFGERHVTFTKVDGPENLELEATVIFPDDPAKRIQVTWHDAERTRPQDIKIGAPGVWVAPHGVRIGLPLADVEKRHGAPFRLTGFGWDNAGIATFRGGRLAKLPGGCTLTLHFEPAQNPLSARFRRITGNREIKSDDRLVREAAPKVVEIYLSYKDKR